DLGILLERVEFVSIMSSLTLVVAAALYSNLGFFSSRLRNLMNTCEHRRSIVSTLVSIFRLSLLFLLGFIKVNLFSFQFPVGGYEAAVPATIWISEGD
ncbi:hypothetical protein ACJX0J_016631, partial [Zea mays]